MGFDREPAVRRRDEAGASDSNQFAHESLLILSRTHMFDYGIRMDNVECQIGKRERASVSGDEVNLRKSFSEFSKILDPYRSHLSGVWVSPQEVIFVGKIVKRRDADVEHALSPSRGKGSFVQLPFPPPRPSLEVYSGRSLRRPQPYDVASNSASGSAHHQFVLSLPATTYSSSAG